MCALWDFGEPTSACHGSKRSGLLLAALSAVMVFFISNNKLIFPNDVSSSNSAARQRAEEIDLFLPKFENKTVTEPHTWLVSLVNRTDVSPSTICVPPKAGSTSFYRTLYKTIHGKEWDFEDPPWVQRLDNTDRWTNVNAKVRRNWADFRHHNPAKSIALIRDPKARILSSWKSKIMCYQGVDFRGQRGIVPELLKLAGLPMDLAQEYIDETNTTSPCLGLSTFLHILFLVHSQGKDGLLNGHFRPQHLYCFFHAPPSQWDIITTINAPDLLCQLKSVLGMSDFTQQDECSTGMPLDHASGDLSSYANLTASDEAILDAITREEYELLGPYLS